MDDKTWRNSYPQGGKVSAVSLENIDSSLGLKYSISMPTCTNVYLPSVVRLQTRAMLKPMNSTVLSSLISVIMLVSSSPVCSIPFLLLIYKIDFFFYRQGWCCTSSCP